MFTFPMFRRQDDRPTTRRPEARRRSPLVESLEGRQVLSTLTFTKIEMNVSAIVGQHIGTNVAAVQGAHIGTNVAAVQGAHIGMSVAAIQGNHIGMDVVARKH
jgi:uncharacterized protein YcfJ